MLNVHTYSRTLMMMFTKTLVFTIVGNITGNIPCNAVSCLSLPCLSKQLGNLGVSAVGQGSIASTSVISSACLCGRLHTNHGTGTLYKRDGTSNSAEERRQLRCIRDVLLATVKRFQTLSQLIPVCVC